MEDSEYWDKRALGYAKLTRDHAFLEAYDKAIALSGIEGKQANCILDISCGNGVLLSRAIKRSKTKLLIGVDYSAEMLKLAKENLRDAGACVSSKPLEAYKRLAALLKRPHHLLSAPDQYRKVWDEYTAIKEKRAGKPLAVLLKQDMAALSFEVKPVADVVFFMFPAFGSLRGTNMPIKELNSLVREIQAWSSHLSSLGNALNYLREGGRLVVMLTIASKEGLKGHYGLHKQIFKAMERLGCKVSHFEVYRNQRLAGMFNKFYEEEGFELEFLTAVFTRTKDTAKIAALREDIVKSMMEALNVLKLSRLPARVCITRNRQGRLCIAELGGQQIDLDEITAKIAGLMG